MNSIFSADRFWKLERRSLFLSKMQYIYILGGLTGLYLLSMLLNVLLDSNFSELVILIASVIIIGAPCFLESSVNKLRSVFDFILPVSSFEKFLSFWIKYVFIIPVSILLLFAALNLITGIVPVDTIKEHAGFMSVTENFKYEFIRAMIVLQAVFMTGYFYFKKYAFGKTSLILIASFVLFVVVIIAIMILMFEQGNNELSFHISSDSIEANGLSYNAGYNTGRTLGMKEFMTDPLIKIAGVTLKFVTAIGLWIVCFFKLRETEI